jgi:hypothetical protein
MSNEEYTEVDILKELQQKRIKTGTQKILANELGISSAFLSDVLQGRRKIGERIPSQLGYQKKIKFEENKIITFYVKETKK